MGTPLNVAILMSRVRVEEKLLLTELDKRGVAIQRIDDREIKLDLLHPDLHCDVVLERDGKNLKKNGCNITDGEWYSVYDGLTLSDPLEVDIDHMVPLANAWRSGADKWTDQKRSDFANDLDRPQLIAVSRGSNRSKGDQDPSQWKPPSFQYYCTYAKAWITVKTHWQLTITKDEKGALTDMLGTCV